MFLHPLPQVSLWYVVSLDIGGHELLVGHRLQATQLLQLDDELPVVFLVRIAVVDFLALPFIVIKFKVVIQKVKDLLEEL